MNFLNPWLAAGVAAVVVPALLILYFLKLRRREELVSSTLLWKRAVQDLQVNAPFQRLRRNLLLLLQLLVLLLAILALARPIIETTVVDEARVVLLIDHSASMNTIEADGETRLAKAKEQAVRLLRTLNQRTRTWMSFLRLEAAEAPSQAMVIAFAEHASIITPFTTNTTELESLIRGIEPTDGRTGLREALELAEAYMAPPTRTTDRTPVSAETPAKLVLISDGRIPNLDEVVLRGGTLEFLRIGAAEDNVAITTFRTRRNYERPDELDVFLTVENFGPAEVATDVSIYVDGTLRDVEPLTLAARSGSATMDEAATVDDGGPAMRLSYRLTVPDAALVEGRLARDDALRIDNRSFAVVPPPRKLRVLVVTERNFLLESVLAGLPLAGYPFVRPEQYEANAGDAYVIDGQSRYDVVVFDKYAPQTLPAGNYLFLGATPPFEDLSVQEKVGAHRLIWWRETHPTLRHVALDPVVVFESQPLTLPEAAEALIEGPDGPEFARIARDGRHCLVLAFPIEQCNWVSRPTLPVFMYNVIRYLGGGADIERGPVRPGEPLRIPIPPRRETLRLVRPDGSTATVGPEVDGVAYYANTNQVGLYRAPEGVPNRNRFAVNLEDADESNITPPPPLTIGRQEVAEVQAILTATPEVWRWFIGAALALVLLEWWIYNRRVMI